MNDLPFEPDLPVNPDHIMTLSPRGSDDVSDTYSPLHDIVNCVPGAFKGMCQLIQNQEPEIAAEELEISDEEMVKAVKAMYYVFSSECVAEGDHATFTEVLQDSGLADVSWQARTWVLKNFGEMMLRTWWALMRKRINDVKRYRDRHVTEAAEAAMETLRKKNKNV